MQRPVDGSGQRARQPDRARQQVRFAEPQRSKMEAVLKDLIERVKSRDIFEVLSKSLAS